jgi:predicted DNA-binding transcriptional regulator AlpA
MPRKSTPRTAVMNTREAAVYVGLSESTLEKLRVYSEDGPEFVTIGSAVRYRIRDLDDWLTARLSRSVRDRVRRRNDLRPD